jgi:hypothetical protein
MPYVYETHNLITNCKYIGYCSKEPNKSKSYLGSGKILNAAIKKYGKENFLKTIIKEFDNETDARLYEEYLIDKYNAINSSDYYNLTKGGFGGWSDAAITSRSSYETKNKIRNTLTGRKRPKEVGVKSGMKLKGRKQTPEAIEARRIGILNYKNADKDVLNDRNKKVSVALKDKPKSESTKIKLGKLNAKYSDEIILHVKQLINDGVPYKQIEKLYGIGAESCTRIKQEKSYKWLWT